jgi:Spy/CpxP family protein refolding chaperone
MMKRLAGVAGISLISVAILTGTSAYGRQGSGAQEIENATGTHADSVETQLASLTRQLNLTDAQKRKIRPLLKREMRRIKQVESNSSLSEHQVRRRVATIRSNTHDRIGEVLTADQQKKWDSARDERHHETPAASGSQPSASAASPQKFAAAQ